MGVPNVNIIIEPGEGDAVFYSSLAAQTANHKADALLCLSPTITNLGSATVQLKKIQLKFIGPPAVPDLEYSRNVSINPGKFAEVHFTPADKILLPFPAPFALRAKFFFDGFAEPIELFRRLVRHANPTPWGSYRFPGKISDLDKGQFWHGFSGQDQHGGEQRFAYDMGVRQWDPGKNDWSGHPGKSGAKNENYLIWGRPIYAMSGGVVVDFQNDIPDNEPGQTKPESNHFQIRRGDEVLLYAHFMQGSLNEKLCFIGAEVEAGQFLGRAGNSGHSSAPHLHIHALKSGSLRPLLFHGIQVIAQSALTPGNIATAPWNAVEGRGLPSVSALIWPAEKRP